ncbi:hypothetical protein HJB81_08770 [Rhizobium sp. NZLR1]|nr:hypothetical protein [Rhizobium sp. NZLR8]MBX5166663.1 hypothetical protein [Rhizobium sp. NZLR4b]MBX5171323.1 hypothetical protein [Rhizobium sp. NZLR1b]MBX5182332.1 hypothetical protein [Rhizobium sp. NZLR5]MBX5190246.1 hypothetical protein [Rhizobium sp. NZLR3b]MBX5194443.1 hypothetical protein [Rhizobium sp. NZLR10]MBX5201472.1 hypothetical protein [Rhizobium sp. NZLR1]MBX5210979.1 hypothetical protein [Rhizobium sp. NZLR11]
MGRFFSGNNRSRDTIGNNRLIAAVSLSAQGCCDRQSGLTAAPSSRSLLSFSARSDERHGFPGDVDTGFVTFVVYDYGEGGKADAATVESLPRRLLSGHAVSRVVLNDALKIRPSREGQWAGCDAGKGAMELAAGSLASKKYIRGMHSASAAASCLR